MCILYYYKIQALKRNLSVSLQDNLAHMNNLDGFLYKRVNTQLYVYSVRDIFHNWKWYFWWVWNISHTHYFLLVISQGKKKQLVYDRAFFLNISESRYRLFLPPSGLHHQGSIFTSVMHRSFKKKLRLFSVYIRNEKYLYLICILLRTGWSLI